LQSISSEHPRINKPKRTPITGLIRRHNMDRRTDWPWSSEEEAEWKAELEEKDNDLLEEMIDSAADNGLTGSPYVSGSRETPGPDDVTPEKYLVAA
jgi:hypothetical protein